ncbi:MAG: ABC transporter permease [Chloroflexi bacterium]|nr:ABC transporter permease [Chloroflexota bacterium]
MAIGRATQSSYLPRNQIYYLLGRLLRSRNGIVGGLLVLALALVALGAQLLSQYDPILPDIAAAFSAPSAAHPFGTDNFGRDILARVLYGARVSLLMGAIPIVLAGSIGVLLGLIAGYFRGWLETAIQAAIDVLLAFPGILLALAIVAMLGPGLGNLMIAVGISWIPSYARLARSSVLVARELSYVEAARAIGCSEARVLLVHILPNIVAPLIVLATLGIAQAILAGSALSFIGLGIKPPTPEWGTMLSVGRNFVRLAWWMSVFPGLAITVSVLAFNLLGDGLRDTLDPHSRL